MRFTQRRRTGNQSAPAHIQVPGKTRYVVDMTVSDEVLSRIDQRMTRVAGQTQQLAVSSSRENCWIL
jgi:hypothetical protein